MAPVKRSARLAKKAAKAEYVNSTKKLGYVTMPRFPKVGLKIEDGINVGGQRSHVERNVATITSQDHHGNKKKHFMFSVPLPSGTAARGLVDEADAKGYDLDRYLGGCAALRNMYLNDLPGAPSGSLPVNNGTTNDPWHVTVASSDSESEGEEDGVFRAVSNDS